MDGDRAASFLALAVLASRVTARRVKEEAELGLDRMASITEPPCLPVAPVMRRTFDMIVERYV